MRVLVGLVVLLLLVPSCTAVRCSSACAKCERLAREVPSEAGPRRVNVLDEQHEACGECERCRSAGAP